MKTSKLLRTLFALNAILLTTLLIVSLSAQPASAQYGLRGDYLMTAGKIIGRSDLAAIYIMELKTQRLAAILFDTRTKKLQKVAGREINQDIRAGSKR